jgi:hypothetical protein
MVTCSTDIAPNNKPEKKKKKPKKPVMLRTTMLASKDFEDELDEACKKRKKKVKGLVEVALKEIFKK